MSDKPLDFLDVEFGIMVNYHHEVLSKLEPKDLSMRRQYWLHDISERHSLDFTNFEGLVGSCLYIEIFPDHLIEILRKCGNI